jgi:hypothetical protein
MARMPGVETPPRNSASDAAYKESSVSDDLYVSQLLQRLAHEDGWVERKTSAHLGDIKEAVVAFANSLPDGQDAVLFLGVEEDRTIVGLSNPESAQRTVDAACQHCYPPIKYTCKVVPVSGAAHPILAVIVGASRQRPHFTGAAFVREGSRTKQATDAQYEDLITSRHDKGRANLGFKGRVVTVSVLRKMLGSTQVYSDSQLRATHECRVESCTPHVVRLYEPGSGTNYAEPLKNVTISYDTERHRDMLIVQPAP